MKLLIRSILLFSAPAICTPADSVRILIDAVAQPLLQQRLEMGPLNASRRRAALESLFRSVGCDSAHLAELPVPHRDPNVVCTLPCASEDVIVVGGHYDLVDRGMGAVDDWSGSVLLPSLYQSLKNEPRRHSFIFAAFAAEETGLHGSTEYVKQLSPSARSAIHAMVNLECLGTSGPKVWATRADKRLLDLYLQLVHAIGVEAAASNVDKVGDDDSHPFLSAKIPVITIHSITRETLPILHTSRDNLKAIHPDDYYAAYRVAANYLAYLDAMLD